MADRGRNFLWVVDTNTDEVVNTIDLLMLSPNGRHVFMSLRGPNQLSADPHVSTGSTPGVGVMKVRGAGRNGSFETVAPASNLDSTNIERADVHALTIRLK